MLNALGDCIPIIVQVKHESSPQVMMDSFEKEIGDALTEVCKTTRTLSFQSLTRSSSLSLEGKGLFADYDIFVLTALLVFTAFSTATLPRH